MQYSVVIVEKQEDLTPGAFGVIREEGITQTLVRDKNTIFFRGGVLKKSVANLMTQITITIEVRTEQGKAYTLSEADREYLSDILAGKPSGVGINELVDMENRLLNIHSGLDEVYVLKSKEEINGEPFKYGYVGDYIYYLSLESKEISFRLYIEDSVEGFLMGEYEDARKNDPKKDTLPYGFIKLDDLCFL